MKKPIIKNSLFTLDNITWYLFVVMLAIMMKKLGLVLFPYLIISLIVLSTHFEIFYKKQPIRLKTAITCITFTGMLFSILQG